MWVETRLIEIDARRTRLMAERDGVALQFPAALTARRDDPDYGVMASAAMADETVLFSGRVAGRQSKISQLNERIGQLANEVDGLRAQKAATERSVALLVAEIADLRQLQAKGLVQMSRLRSSERDAANLDGQVGSLSADLARKEGEATEIRMQIQETELTAQSDTIEELRKLEAERGDLLQRLVAAQDKLRRTVLLAPVSGVVHELAVHTQGGVLTAGQTAMSIVPENQNLLIDVKIAPTDVDQVAIDQPVRLRLSAFNQRTTPEINGKVVSVSPDLSRDDATGQSWYLLRVSPDLSEVSGLSLRPGMPVEAFLLGHQRTLLSYLLKPVTDQMQTALRED